MPEAVTHRRMKVAILQVLADGRHRNRYNMLGGRGDGGGDIERHMETAFSSSDRRTADEAFLQLLAAGHIQSTYRDIVNPGDWVEITEAGRAALSRKTLDQLDEVLDAIAPNLVELRAGAHAALYSSHPDAHRQAAHSARELLDQVLKEGAKDVAVHACPWFVADPNSRTGVTRRHRLRYLMEKHTGHTSGVDLKESEAACELLIASTARLLSLAHSRGQVGPSDDVRGTLMTMETALRQVLVAAEPVFEIGAT